MNTQRREEIKVIAECPNDRHWAQEMRRAVAEILTHIDTLEQMAAERVIADGSRGPTPDYTGEGSAWVPPKIKPHIFAQMVNEVRDLARQYGQVEQFRCRVADLLGKYIHVEHNSKGVPEQTKAPAVVMPPPGDRVGWVRVDRWKNEGGRAVWVNLDEVLQAGRLRANQRDRNMKPHTFAQMVNEVRNLAFDFGTSEQFRDRVSDLLGRYINANNVI